MFGQLEKILEQCSCLCSLTRLFWKSPVSPFFYVLYVKMLLPCPKIFCFVAINWSLLGRGPVVLLIFVYLKNIALCPLNLWFPHSLLVGWHIDISGSVSSCGSTDCGFPVMQFGATDRTMRYWVTDKPYCASKPTTGKYHKTTTCMQCLCFYRFGLLLMWHFIFSKLFLRLLYNIAGDQDTVPCPDIPVKGWNHCCLVSALTRKKEPGVLGVFDL